jgi:hypothetical protein
MTTLEDRIAQAIADPGAVVGRKLGPSWGRGNDGYTKEEETVTHWSTRAVLTALDKAGALLPTTGRTATFRPGSEGRDSTAVIQLEGPYAIFRFMVNLLGHQVDIGSAGRAVLVDLRDHMTPERFDLMARSLLGADRYEKLRDRFERDWDCDGCEQTIRVGRRYAPTDNAGAVCAACCKGFPEYTARLVKRLPEAAAAPA